MRHNIVHTVVLSFCTAVAFGQTVTKEFSVPPFDRVNVGSAIDVEVRKGNFNVEVDLPPGETKYLNVKSEGGTLMVRFSRPAGSWLNTEKNRKSPRIIVTMPKLRGISLSGASDGEVEDSFDFDELDLELSGASDLKINNLKAKNIRLKASGASDTRLQGKAGQLTAELSGASDLKGYELTVDQAVIRASGASDASITVMDRLEKHTRGGGDISHRGNPRTVISDENKSRDNDDE